MVGRKETSKLLSGSPLGRYRKVSPCALSQLALPLTCLHSTLLGQPATASSVFISAAPELLPDTLGAQSSEQRSVPYWSITGCDGG